MARGGAQVVVQQEASPRTIGQEPYNTAWVGHCFGAATLRRIAGERPVCGGGIAATPLGMRALKDAFCRLLWRRVNDQNRVCNDQGILNYLAYAGGDNNHAARGGVPLALALALPHELAGLPAGEATLPEGITNTLSAPRRPVEVAAVKRK